MKTTSVRVNTLRFQQKNVSISVHELPALSNTVLTSGKRSAAICSSDVLTLRELHPLLQTFSTVNWAYSPGFICSNIDLCDKRYILDVQKVAQVLLAVVNQPEVNLPGSAEHCGGTAEA
ncbi:hypothetical protein J6590_079225 [Homalodisca vitripennis]|nr:hypothetical protein J6590_079225 [Homalodisca vitripennis]